MRGLRRAVLAIAMGTLFAALIRLRGTGGSPPRKGGWRELEQRELLEGDLGSRGEVDF